ncbi:MAG: hypothetical protein WA862_02890 [Solirubrobacterales bacterium]
MLGGDAGEAILDPPGLKGSIYRPRLFLRPETPSRKFTLLAQFAHTAKPFVFYGEDMATDWNEARLDRLGERIDRIEEARRQEKQRSLDHWTYAMLAALWLTVIATIVLANVKAAS